MNDEIKFIYLKYIARKVYLAYNKFATYLRIEKNINNKYYNYLFRVFETKYSLNCHLNEPLLEMIDDSCEIYL